MDINSSANICTTYDDFDFSKVVLTHPESLHSGSFFTKLNLNNNMFYIQTPKCISKQGVVTTAGKKSYIDLMLSCDDEKFIEFMENLEKHCVDKIYDKKNSWFTNDIDKSDIENAFTSALRSLKAGKYYVLRANIASSKNLLKTPTCFVFDESEKELSIDDVKPDNELITVLEIQGIKFTPRSFQFEIIIRQALIMSNKPVFQSYVIKKNIPTPSNAVEHSTQNNNTTREIQNVSNINIGDLVKDVKDSKHGENNVKSEKDIIDLKENISSLGSKVQPLPIPASASILSLTSKKIEKNSNKNQQKDDMDDTDDMHDINELNDITNITEIQNIETIKELTEADLEIKDDESIKLKKPNDIYYEVYRAAKEKARTARKLAFDAYLEVKKIKKTYMLDDSDSDFSDSSDSDNDDNDDNSDNEEEAEQ
jgi:hypothetical protein